MSNLPNEVPPRSLADLPVGARAIVADVAGGPDTRRRLLELGILPGVSVSLVRRAPFGCPLEAEVGGSRYVLRHETAAVVMLRTGAA